MADSRTLAGSLFDYILDLCHNDPFTLHVIGSFIVVNLTYLIGNIFFVFLDFLDPDWVQPYRIQDGESKKISFEKWIGALKLISFNMTVCTFAVAYAVYKTGLISDSRELPSLFTVIFQLFIFTLIEEVNFYYGHRLFHHPRLYKYVHKVHHEFTAPVSITSVYAHPVEHVMANVTPLFMGPMIFGSHIMVCWAWIVFSLYSKIAIHSGYHLPFTPSPEHHDYHHLSYSENYGILGILDKLHGTSKTFDSSVRATRHRTTFTLEPVKVTFPDKKDK